MLAAVLLSPRGRRLSEPKMSEAADELFSKYAAEAPTTQGRLYARCWDIVNNAIAATVPAAVHDARVPLMARWKHLSLRGQMTLR